MYALPAGPIATSCRTRVQSAAGPIATSFDRIINWLSPPQVAGLGLSSDTSVSRGDTRAGFGGRGEFIEVILRTCMFS